MEAGGQRERGQRDRRMQEEVCSMVRKIETEDRGKRGDGEIQRRR